MRTGTIERSILRHVNAERKKRGLRTLAGRVHGRPDHCGLLRGLGTIKQYVGREAVWGQEDLTRLLSPSDICP